jgi:hypothetical protein
MTHDLRIRPVSRSTAALAVAVAAVVALSGCVGLGSRNPGGTVQDVDERTSSDVVAELRQVPGVLDAVVTSGPNGLPSQVELHAGLNLEAGYPGDLPTLLDYTLALAWSVTAEEPTTVVSVGILAGESALDLGPVAAELGWTGVPGPGLDLSVDDLAERYGPWPGAVPERPAALG